MIQCPCRMAIFIEVVQQLVSSNAGQFGFTSDIARQAVDCVMGFRISGYKQNRKSIYVCLRTRRDSISSSKSGSNKLVESTMAGEHNQSHGRGSGSAIFGTLTS